MDKTYEETSFHDTQEDSSDDESSVRVDGSGADCD